MDRTRILTVILGAVLAGASLSAQGPASDIDTRINAAKAAAGLDYRATFVNLCFSGANPGLANPAVARAGGAAPGAARGQAGGRAGGTPDRATWYASPLQSIRQPVLAWHQAALVVGAAHE